MKAYTLQSLFQEYFAGYKQMHRLPLYQLKAISLMQRCRTQCLGGHSQYCPNGHLNGVWYNSCKHRSCPQCQGLPSARWLHRAKKGLIDTTHHHWIFTMPHELNVLWRFNRGLFQDALFKAVSQTIKELSLDSKYLEATPGYMLTLHTWGRNLSLHPHIHCLITHGGLKGGRWLTPKRRRFLPAKVLMMLYRGKILSVLRQQTIRQEMTLPPSLSKQQTLNLLNKLGRKDWVVECCKPYTHGGGVATYLARYVKGGPIKNSQIQFINNGQVGFRYKSHRTHKIETLTLPVEAFISRVLEHIPIPSKMSIRHYGLYHGSNRERLNQARQNFKQEPLDEPEFLTWQAYLQGLKALPVCEVCGVSMGGELAETAAA